MPDVPAIKRLSQGRVQCTVSFSSEQEAKAEAQAVELLGSSIRIPGFRAGRAPLEVLKERLPTEALFEETIRMLLKDSLGALAKEHNLKPILPPKVEAQSRNPLTVTITFVERPAVKVKGGEKIRIEKKTHKVEEKDVERMIRYLVEQYRTMTVVDRAAKEGDQVTIDFVGTDKDGKEVPGIRTVGYPVIIGSKTLLPGFEDNLITMKVGDRKSFTLTFPEKYHAEHLRGKPVTFAVTLGKVEEVHTPELTDAFVKEKGVGENLAEVRTRIEQSMIEEEERIERQRREQALFEAVREATRVDLAPELVEQTIRSLFEEGEEELRQQKSSMADWLKKSGKKVEDFEKELREQAVQRLTLRFGIEQLLEDRKVEASDDEVRSLLEDKSAEPGSEAFEQSRWQKRVEKLVESLLAA